MTSVCVRAENDFFLEYGWIKLGFSVEIEIDLTVRAKDDLFLVWHRLPLLLCMVEIILTSVWGIEIHFFSAQGSD